MEPLQPRRDTRALGVKRKTFEQDHDSAESPSGDCTCHSLMLASLKKYAVSPMLCTEEIRRFVLLKNTIKHLQEDGTQPLSQGSWEEVPQPLPHRAPPSHGTSPNPLAGCSVSDSAASLMDPAEELHCAVDNLMMLGTDNGTGTPSAFPGPCRDVMRMASAGGLADLYLDAFFPTAGESLYGEGLQQDPSSALHLGFAGPRADADDALGSSSGDMHASPEQEGGSAWGVFFQEELLCDATSRSFEVFTSHYLSNLPCDDLFADIDTSEFGSILDVLPSDGQPSPTCAGQATCENSQAEVQYFPSQNARCTGDLDHSGGLLLSF